MTPANLALAIGLTLWALAMVVDTLLRDRRRRRLQRDLNRMARDYWTLMECGNRPAAKAKYEAMTRRREEELVR